MDVLSDAADILSELGVHFEIKRQRSRRCRHTRHLGDVSDPRRGDFKSTAGTNVASDALSNLSSSGVTGGALIILGEDYGEGSSIMQERSHAFAMKSQLWLLDPRPNLPSIVRMVEHGFALSEASNTPVMLEVRIRACHVHGSFIAKDNRPPPFSLSQARNAPVRDTSRIVLPPASFAHERDKIARRWPAAIDYIRTHGLNEFFDGELKDVGIILQGGMYNGVMRALLRMGLADIWGNTRVPLYVLNVTYPLVDAEIVGFCTGKRAVLVVEECQPDFIEQALDQNPQRGRFANPSARASACCRWPANTPSPCWRKALEISSPPSAWRSTCHHAQTRPRCRMTNRSVRWPTSCRRDRRAFAPAVPNVRFSPR